MYKKKAPREMEYLRTTEDTMNYALAQSRICNYGQYMRIKLFGPSQPYAFVANKYPYVTSDDCRHMLMVASHVCEILRCVRVRKIILSRYPPPVNIFESRALSICARCSTLPLLRSYETCHATKKISRCRDLNTRPEAYETTAYR